jgi:hypothetical protein
VNDELAVLGEEAFGLQAGHSRGNVFVPKFRRHVRAQRLYLASKRPDVQTPLLPAWPGFLPLADQPQ